MKRISEKFNLLAKRQQGFTLIELLIVIVIIGILAGVLIAVIDPAAQQNRARDANVQATINKMALAVGGFRSAYGRSPDGFEFRSLIQGFALGTGPANHCTAGNNICHFTMTTIPLLSACNASPNNYYGSITASTNACNWRYEKNGVNDWWIYAKSYGINNGVFKYDSTTSEIKQCTDTNVGTC